MSDSEAVNHLAMTTMLTRSAAVELLADCAALDITPARVVEFVDAEGVYGMHVLMTAVRCGVLATDIPRDLEHPRPLR